jgi:hypothetical protein
MVSAFALLCAVILAPSECTRANAIDVVALPDAPNELMCMQESMAIVASLAIQPRPDEYWKFVCVRSTAETDVAGEQTGRGSERLDQSP